MDELETITNIIPEETKKYIYNDGLKPTVSEVGKTLSLVPRVVNGALAKVEMWCMNREFMVDSLKIELEAKLANKKQENIVEASPRTFIPAAQAVSYSWEEEDIRKLYVNLMVADMDASTKNSIHPGFVEIIKQMSTIDVKLFTMLYKNEILPVYKIQRKGTEGGASTVLQYLLPDIYYNINDDVNVIVKSLNNLERLKLIEISYENQYTYKDNYLSIDNGTKCIRYKEILKDVFERQEGVIEKTAYGLDFYKICCKE